MWAATAGLADECKEWPVPSGAPKPAAGRLPNVPVLILSGDRDVRTPTSEARQVAAEFPQSRLLIVGGAGHAVLSYSTCANQYLVAWLQGLKHGSCPRLPLPLSPLERYPAEPGDAAFSARRTLALTQETLREAGAAWLTTQGAPTPLAGLAGGELVPGSDDFSFTLDRYSDVAGLTLSGRIAYDPGDPAQWVGEIDVSGRSAAAGKLTAGHGRLSGTLGRLAMSAPMAPGGR
jgi:hypothetical protein